MTEYDEHAERLKKLFKEAEASIDTVKNDQAYSELRKELDIFEQSISSGTSDINTAEENEYRKLVNTANRAARYCRTYGTDKGALKELHKAIENYLGFVAKIEKTLGKEEVRRISSKYSLHVKI